MNDNMSIKKYYAIGLIPYLIIVILFFFINMSFASKLYFYLAYFWSFYLLAPQVEKTIQKRRYRFAFVKLIYLANSFLQKLNKFEIPYVDSLIRSLSPFIFVTIFFAIGRQGNILFALLGALTFEFIMIIYIKRTNQSV